MFSSTIAEPVPKRPRYLPWKARDGQDMPEQEPKLKQTTLKDYGFETKAATKNDDHTAVEDHTGSNAVADRKDSSSGCDFVGCPDFIRRELESFAGLRFQASLNWTGPTFFVAILPQEPAQFLEQVKLAVADIRPTLTPSDIIDVFFGDKSEVIKPLRRYTSWCLLWKHVKSIADPSNDNLPDVKL
ncbi:hypothetical protein TWF481_002846 [Arthrobotrys musiformis]|uniref:Uncharacterized protein n=1 Tax=Arthrobotrys musiformis TaxID=47236 RepID=A0AAV9VRD6_9PEZI